MIVSVFSCMSFFVRTGLIVASIPAASSSGNSSIAKSHRYLWMEQQWETILRRTVRYLGEQQQLNGLTNANHAQNVNAVLQVTLHPNGGCLDHNNETPRCSDSFSIMPSTKQSQNFDAITLSSADGNDSTSDIAFDKYYIESILTEYFAAQIIDTGTNQNSTNRLNTDGTADSCNKAHCWTHNREATSLHSNEDSDVLWLYNYCDMGDQYTVVQNDFTKLIRIPVQLQQTNRSTSSSDSTKTVLPCRWYTREGVRIKSIEHIQAIIQKRLDVQFAASENQVGNVTSVYDDFSRLSLDSNIDIKIDGTTSASDTTASRSLIVPLHLYAVPAGRMFMFPASSVGETFTLDHVNIGNENTSDGSRSSNGNKSNSSDVVSLTVLSLEPRVFDVHNFFSSTESDALMQKALAETSESHKFHRSTTGTSSSSIYQKRTSENAWDTHGTVAQRIKRRCFQLLGIDEYVEEMSDGLQILRYNLTTAYTSHLDYLEDRANVEPYDYDTSHKGGNRFATIILYFTSLGEHDGGETVFPKVYPPTYSSGSAMEHISSSEGLQQLRDSGDTKGILTEGSWEEEMTVLCRTRLSIRPQALRAVLFYSQFPNGTLDPLSFHGGCPVLRGTKLAANLWTWSAIRPEFEGGPHKFNVTKNTNESYDDDDEDDGDNISKTNIQEIYAIFRNRGVDDRYKNAELYYNEDGYFGKIGFNDAPIAVKTYAGHIWNIKDASSKMILKSFVVADDSADQTFEV